MTNRIAPELQKSLEEAAKEESLIVYLNNKPVSRINPYLLDKQKAWDNLTAIKAEHVIKLNIYEAIKQEVDKAALKCYAQNLTDLEFRLQKLWGFPKDARFHKWWWTPKCECAKMDNDDAYPSGCYTVNLSCPLHGE